MGLPKEREAPRVVGCGRSVEGKRRPSGVVVCSFCISWPAFGEESSDAGGRTELSGWEISGVEEGLAASGVPPKVPVLFLCCRSASKELWRTTEELWLSELKEAAVSMT